MKGDGKCGERRHEQKGFRARKNNRALIILPNRVTGRAVARNPKQSMVSRQVGECLRYCAAQLWSLWPQFYQKKNSPGARVTEMRWQRVAALVFDRSPEVRSISF